MPKAPKEDGTRKSITDSKLKSEIIKALNTNSNGKTALYGVLRTKYKLGKDRFFAAYDLYYKEWAELKSKAENEAITTETKTAVIKGLKSKLDRQLFYQDEIANLEKQLRGETEFTFMIGLRVHRSHKKGIFSVPMQVLNEIRNQIKNYQTELSRMEGDYAPSKFAKTNKDGDDIPPPKENEIDYTKLPTELLEALVNASRNK